MNNMKIVRNDMIEEIPNIIKQYLGKYIYIFCGRQIENQYLFHGRRELSNLAKESVHNVLKFFYFTRFGSCLAYLLDLYIKIKANVTTQYKLILTTNYNADSPCFYFISCKLRRRPIFLCKT